MNTITREAIEAFLHGQVSAWNAGDKEAFLDHYRRVAPGSLETCPESDLLFERKALRWW